MGSLELQDIGDIRIKGLVEPSREGPMLGKGLVLVESVTDGRFTVFVDSDLFADLRTFDDADRARLSRPVRRRLLRRARKAIERQMTDGYRGALTARRGWPEEWEETS